AGAYLSEYGFGLYPCEMCWWLRYPHFAAIGLGLISAVARPRALWIGLAGVAILVSGAIGVFHAGVEYRWWEGITACTGPPLAGGNALEAILAAPMVRCDQPAWTLLGISLVGFNALISIVTAGAIFALLARGRGR